MKENNNKFVYTDEDIQGIVITKKGSDEPTPEDDKNGVKEIKMEHLDIDDMPFEGANWYNEVGRQEYENREIWFMARDFVREDEDYECKFRFYPSTLMNDVHLCVKNDKNQVTACELFYFDEQLHADPYCDRNDAMLTADEWYINERGLNITFGIAKEKNIYASFLICSIRNIETNEQICGAKNVQEYIAEKVGADELYTMVKERKDVFSNAHLYLDLLDIEDREHPIRPTTEKRKEIQQIPEDSQGFIDRLYRYFIERDLDKNEYHFTIKK